MDVGALSVYGTASFLTERAKTFWKQLGNLCLVLKKKFPKHSNPLPNWGLQPSAPPPFLWSQLMGLLQILN